MLALSLLGFAASANAATIYNFTFNDGADEVASGWFETDGAAVDPGYELIVSLWFNYAEGIDLGEFGPFRGHGFHDGQAYNPMTGAFINHRFGTEHNLGGMGAVGSPQDLSLYSDVFALNGRLGGVVRDNGELVDRLRSGDLTVTPDVTAVPAPEPASLVLLGTGLIGAAVARRRAASPRRRA